MSRERELIESAARLCEERADHAEKNADALKEFGGEYSGNEASMAAVERPKEPRASETAVAAADHLIVHNVHDGMEFKN